MLATTVDDVIAILDQIIVECRADGDRVGFFAALYRQITVRVRDGIIGGLFDDGPRMSAFDAAFANRYFAAYDAFRAGATTPKCWATTFATTHSRPPHHPAGARARHQRARELRPRRGNGPDVRRGEPAGLPVRLRQDQPHPRGHAPAGRDHPGGVSPFIGLLAQAGGTTAIEALDFSIRIARGDALLHATLLSTAAGGDPALIRETERQDVAAVIDALLTI
jgi:hypothetical protein